MERRSGRAGPTHFDPPSSSLLSALPPSRPGRLQGLRVKLTYKNNPGFFYWDFHGRLAGGVKWVIRHTIHLSERGERRHYVLYEPPTRTHTYTQMEHKGTTKGGLSCTCTCWVLASCWCLKCSFTSAASCQANSLSRTTSFIWQAALNEQGWQTADYHASHEVIL